MVRLRELRLSRNWTAAQLAERIGEQGVSITENAIYNVEIGAKQASARLLDAWMRALGADPLNVWHGPLRKPVEPAPRVGRRAC